jgi:LPXTG-motif cell wall-anchored protein
MGILPLLAVVVSALAIIGAAAYILRKKKKI